MESKRRVRVSAADFGTGRLRLAASATVIARPARNMTMSTPVPAVTGYLVLALSLASTSALALTPFTNDAPPAAGLVRVNDQQDYERAQRHYQEERRYDRLRYQRQQEQRIHDERVRQERLYEQRLQRGY
ncbi:hypothetical protein [Burkholderia glumae]|uniref:Uncharacterized protein n=2 Tax=Burkholderia glumae TaxID=337 RepID=A0AAP9Y6E2_BURGL|nr:hypothetical protein [Burkholderia glumae]MCM2481840.1 hypothetical protein [Burkholderia glumae]MCM2491554.1 hypothetical protein [Burkholderia glumae]MCM2536566.1 hypothetical protein [Burkholderia glumae]MCM2542536.1 hypothetical protein [Burkholderia glumae]MCM2549273.1 hypothetical protein [Burkholderia glumae]